MHFFIIIILFLKGRIFITWKNLQNTQKKEKEIKKRKQLCTTTQTNIYYHHTLQIIYRNV